MAEDASDPIEVNDFKFVQLRKFRIFKEEDGSQLREAINLITASSRFGLLFVGTNEGFKVLKLENILDLDENKDKSRQVAEDYVCHSVRTPTAPVLLALSSDDLTLSVCAGRNDQCVADMYDTRAFADPENNPAPFLTVQLSSHTTQLKDFTWNPVIVEMYAYCLADGSAHVHEVSETNLKICAGLPAQTGATAVCWSPKGKQVVIGKKDGSFSQYKPTLQEVKTVPAPKFDEKIAEILNMHWLSTTQFAVVYLIHGSDSPTLVIVSTPKGVSPTYINFGDICLGSSSEQKPRYLMHHQSEWNILISASANAVETAVIGCTNNEKNTWKSWALEDEGRAELPMVKYKETYPLGISVIFCAQRKIIISETESHPPMPVFFILSTCGLLCPFHMLNTSPGAANIVYPSEPISRDGERMPKGGALPVGTMRQSLPSQLPAQIQQIAPSTPKLQKPTSGPVFPSFQVSSTTLQKQGPALPMAKSNASVPPFSSISFQQTPQNVVVQQPVFVPVVTQAIAQASTPSLPIFQPFTNTLKQPGTLVSGLQPSFVNNDSIRDAQNLGASTGIAQQSISPSRTVEIAVAVSKKSDSVLSKPLLQDLQSRDSPPKAPTIEESAEDLEREAYLLAVSVEIKKFEMEIQKLKNLSMNSCVSIGTKDEMADIKRKTLLLTDYQKDMSETMMSLGMDIQALKTASLECFEMIEDANSKNLQRNDPAYICMLKDRVLDPVIAKRMKKILHMNQYIDNQLQELHKKLDEDYLEVMERNNESRRVFRRIPSTQAICQIIVSNQKIIHNLQGKLQNLAEKFQSVKLNNLSRNRLMLTLAENISFDNDVEKLSHVLLQGKTPVTSAPNTSQIQPGRKKLPASVQSTLRDALTNHKVTCVRPTVISDPSQSRLLSSLRYKKKSEELGKTVDKDATKATAFSTIAKIPEKQSKDQAMGLKPISAFTSKSVFQSATGITQGVPLAGYVTKPKQVPVMQVVLNKNPENQKDTSVSLVGISNQSPTSHLFTHRIQPIAISEGKIVSPGPTASSIISNAGIQQDFQHSPLLKSATSPESSKPDRIKQVPATSPFLQSQKPALYEDITPPSTPVESSIHVPSPSTVGEVVYLEKELMDAIKGQTSLASPFTFGLPSTSSDSSKTLSQDSEPSGEVFVISTEGGKPVAVRVQPNTDENKENSVVMPNECSLSARSPLSMKTPFSNQTIFSQPAAHFIQTPGDKRDPSSEKIKQVSNKENVMASSQDSLIRKDILKDMPKGSSVSFTQQTPKIGFTFSSESKSKETPFVQVATTSQSTIHGVSQFNVPPSSISVSAAGEATTNFFTPKTMPNSFFGSLPSVSGTSATTPSLFSGPTSGTQSSIFGKTTFGGGFTQPATGKVSQPLVSSESNLTSQTGTPNNEQLSSPRISAKTIQTVVTTASGMYSSSGTQPKSVTVATSKNVLPNSSSKDVSSTSTTFIHLSKNLGQTDSPAVSNLFAKSSLTPPVVTTPVGITTTTTSNSNLFGQTENVSTSFGKTDSEKVHPEKLKQDAKDSSFAQVSSTTPSSVSDQARTTSSSIFGQNLTSTASSPFGQVATSTVASPFGHVAPTTAVTSPFGQASTTTASSPFGQASTTTASSPFGQSAKTAASSNLFGQQQQSPSAFSLSTTTTTSGSSFFGSPTSVFGQAGSSPSAFGQTTTTASSAFNQSSFFNSSNTQSSFGQKDQSGSSFGGAQTSPGFGFGQNQSGGSFGLAKAVFGQPQGTTSPFGQSSDQSGGFGLSSFFSGLGGKPDEQSASKNVFGNITASGGNTSSNIFGNQGAMSFGAKPTGFSGGNFTVSGGSVAQSGFGAFQQTPQKSGFGAAPSFGSSPTFGGSPSFGSPPSFGSSPGQPANVGSPGFGSAQATFSNFANNSFPSFGALASQQPTFGQQPPPPQQQQQQQQQNESMFGGGGGSLFGGGSPPSFGAQQTQQQQPSGFGSPSNAGGSSAFTQWRN